MREGQAIASNLPKELTVGGLLCSQVLSSLSDYLDGLSAPTERVSIETHVRGCDICARFGGSFSGAVKALRGNLISKPTAEAIARQRQRLNSF